MQVIIGWKSDSEADGWVGDEAGLGCGGYEAGGEVVVANLTVRGGHGWLGERDADVQGWLWSYVFVCSIS
jgi:hypothetical protein